MINHIRTLIANMARDSSHAPDSYEEYIDAEYAPVTAKFVITDLVMPPGLARHDRNIRVFNIMNILHRPDFMRFMHRFDARIIYSVDDRRVINALADGSERGRIDTALFYNQLHSVIYRDTNLSRLFDCLDFHPDDFAELKALWMGGETPADRCAAAILALAYRMERARNMVRSAPKTVPIAHATRVAAPSSSSSSPGPVPRRDCAYLFRTEWNCSSGSWAPVALAADGLCLGECSATDWELAWELPGICAYERTVCVPDVCYRNWDCGMYEPDAPAAPSSIPADCTAAKGACCHDGGHSCDWLTEADCLALCGDAEWQGCGTLCGPGVCPQTNHLYTECVRPS